jgi:hypothetical protein
VIVVRSLFSPLEEVLRYTLWPVPAGFSVHDTVTSSEVLGIV